MGREPLAFRHRLTLAGTLLSLVGLPGCAYFASTPPPDPSLSHALSDERIRIELEAAIANSMPVVSYQSDDPAIVDPLSKADPSLLLRYVETLDGEGRIVCRKRGETAFGTCVFPSSVSP